MDGEASGTFEVRLTPEPGGAVERRAISKTFAGDLSGTSEGAMLSAGDPAAGAAGYVAIERVTGTLAGREGSFALQHSGTMAAGAHSLSVTVVPGSGEGALAGLEGAMDIRMEGGRHDYVLRYRLP